MKKTKELSELRSKSAKELLVELDKERLARGKDIIAFSLGKMSKIHEIKDRKLRIARLLTVLSEKLHAPPPKMQKGKS